MPQPRAIWNPVRDVWETPNTESLFCGHLAVSSGTFPTSGSMRNGVAYEQPTWEHRTEGSGYSSSPDDVKLLLTPVASEGTKPSNTMGVARRKTTGEVFLTNQIVSLCGLDPSEAQVMDLLPTTTAMDYKASGGAEGSSNLTLTDAIVRGRGLLPTPAACVANEGIDTWDARRERIKAKGINGNGMGEPLTIAALRLLPTPRTSDTNGPGLHGTGGMDLRTAAATLTDWGPYRPAIERWERVLGRPAPAPTEPNAKGNHRLSPKFTEWMMGVPEGWITDISISRNEQLKACGNGVVPQQAAAALRDMFTVFEGAQP